MQSMQIRQMGMSIALLSVVCAALRPDVTVPAEVSDPGTPCQTRCVQAEPGDRDHLNLFQLGGAEAQNISWRLHPNRLHQVRSSADCHTLEDVPSNWTRAYVVQWIDAQKPLDDSSLDVFVNPSLAQRMRFSEGQSFWLCQQESPELQTCLCRLELRRAPDAFGLIGRMTQGLPGSLAASASEWQLSLEEQCPGPGIGEMLVALVAIWVVVLLVLVAEAWFSARADLPSSDHEGKSLDVIVPKPWQHMTRGLKVMSFVMLGQTLQRSTLGVLVKTSAPEPLVWAVTALAAGINFTTVWWFHRAVCRTMLVDSFLARGLVLTFEPSKAFAGLIVGAILVYGLLVVAGSAVQMDSLADLAQLLLFVLGSLAGPAWSLTNTIRTEQEAEQRSTEVHMLSKEFAALHKTSPVSVVHWEALVQAGRAGESEELLRLAEPGADTTKAQAPEGPISDLNMFRDVRWFRHLVRAATGSPAGYVFLPSFALAVALLSVGGGFGAASYLCSRGSLTSLQPAALDDKLDFHPWQDWKGSLTR